MYSRSAPYYDLLYSFKDYVQESRLIEELIRLEHPAARSILDVACGTAEHLKHLAVNFEVSGLDLEPQFVKIARQKLPAARFWTEDMSRFDLGLSFDVVQTLFSSIGYLLEPQQVVNALTCFKNHLNPGGIVLVEPWFSPDAWTPGFQQMLTVDQPGLKICRMSNSAGENSVSKVLFHYLISRPDGVEHFEEYHELALYTHQEMMGFFEQAGLAVRHDPEGIFGRGLYVARAK